jgi:UDP-N-acetylglucosamine--N-acetylmuramyl-(pentapeptide) pyrophosphoryl-undecaprenol N-acetylglucosamine transferase
VTRGASDPGRAYAIITGGGTAGHVLPALAVAEALAARGHDRRAVHYVGAERGIEARLVPPSGFPCTLLPGRGIQRRLTPANLAALWGLLRAFGQALRLVRERRPHVVVAVGGYASVAVAVAAVVLRVPVVVAEQNAVPGAANRLVGRFARAAAVSFPGTALPRAVVTGNPVRPEFLSIGCDRDRAAAKRSIGVDPARRLVLVFGGSLGALRINKAVLGALQRWSDRADLAIHHVIGDRDWDALGATSPPGTGALQYRPVQYEHDMPAVMAAADLVVCRAGSTTCFEVAAACLPSILVPSPHVTADQQTRNARRLVEAGAALLVADADLDGDRLAGEVEHLLDDPAALADMGRAAGAFARPDAADAVAALAEEHARG